MCVCGRESKRERKGERERERERECGVYIVGDIEGQSGKRQH